VKYKHDGDEWFKLGKGFRWACCDCHLIHDVEARTRDGVVEIRIIGNCRATAAMRRKHKKTVVIADA
jgi:Zn-finger protein